MTIMNYYKRIIHQFGSLVQKAYLSCPQRVECNLCAWRGRHLISDSWHPHTVCPRCKSEVRHRLLVAALTYIDSVSCNKVIRNKELLHFAPEQMLEAYFSNYTARYTSADLLKKDVDVALDISNMADIGSCEVDVVIACDVLEHVADDILAIREIHRVLRLWGYAIITVPQMDGLANTFEDKTIIDSISREQTFGQSDHLRIYGDNFPHILESSGFAVTIISEDDFTDDIARKYVLYPPTLSEKTLATNHRKVFFAQKRTE
jgi:SAM-dependent methyltransferase